MATKKITIKQKTSSGYDILYPETIIEQVDGLQEALDSKVDEALDTNYNEKQSLADNDELFINDSAASKVGKYIKASLLKSYVQDAHNKGWFATAAALKAAHPTATNGDFAIVGNTDTMWVWDSDSSDWVDTDTKGQVNSVNGQTGNVVLTIPSAPGTLSTNNTTSQTVPTTPEALSGAIKLHKIAKTGKYSDLIDTPTIPTATSQLTNNSGFITISDVPAQVNADWNATSGAAQILNKPTIPSAPGTLNSNNTTAQTPQSSEALSGSILLHKVSKTGNYNDLLNKPTIPAEQVNSDWNSTSGKSQILNKPVVQNIFVSATDPAVTPDQVLGTIKTNDFWYEVTA